jgi:Mn-containing catalase
VQNVIHRTEELSNIEMIIDLIEKRLDGMYVEAKQLENQLTPNVRIP